MKIFLKFLVLFQWISLLKAAGAGESFPLVVDETFALATQLKPAIILEVADVAKASFKPTSPTVADSTLTHQQYDIMANGTKVGIIDEQARQVIVAFQGIDSLLSTTIFRYLMCSRVPFNGHEGGIHSGVMSVFRPISASKEYMGLFNLDTNNRRKKDFIFTGYGFGGAIALLAGLNFEHRINREGTGGVETAPGLKRNQVKIITFSAPKVVDTDLKRVFSRRIGKENILQFQYYSDYSPTLPCIYEHVGIPISILSYEQMRDTYRDHARWSKFLYGSLTIAGGVLLALSKDTEKNVLLAKKIGGSVVAGLTALDTFLIGTPAIPSSESLFMSFMDTKHNIEDYKVVQSRDGTTAVVVDIPDDVGSVSMFSFQRGCLKWFYRML